MQGFTGVRRLLVGVTVCLMVGVSVATTVPALAQSANASISASVQQPISITKTADLAFGNVFPGVNNTVAPSASGAAAFSVAGQASTNVNISFTLPTNLTSSSNNLAISTWTGVYNTSNSPSGGTSFTPSASTVTVALSGTGALYIFVGATVQPTITQAAGTYTGSLTVTVAYF